MLANTDGKRSLLLSLVCQAKPTKGFLGCLLMRQSAVNSLNTPKWVLQMLVKVFSILDG